jgi:hypothetical protein
MIDSGASHDDIIPNTSRDWRIWFGMSLTAFWLSIGLFYITGVIGVGRFVTQPADTMGGFLEGAFAPLAFLWLVVGFFLQQKELNQNTHAIRRQYDVMRKTAEQAELQARAISLNERHARQQSFLETCQLVMRQLGSIGAFLWMSSQMEDSERATEIDRLFSQLGQGDAEIFSRSLIALHYRALGPANSYDLFFGTPIRTRHSENFMHTFERLLNRAEESDPEGLITDAVRGSSHGIIYSIMSGHKTTGKTA